MGSAIDLSRFNAAQKEAILTTEGPVQVLAAAGSGKTSVATHRAAHLLSQRVPPESLLLTTFTVKAANEMRERLAKLVSKAVADRVVLGTLNAICKDLFKDYVHVLGLRPGFRTLADDSNDLMRALANRYDLGGFRADRVREALSKATNTCKSLHDTIFEDPEYSELAQHWKKIEALVGFYQKEKKAINKVDFDDQMLFLDRLFDLRPDIQAQYQQQFRYIQVDEAQDTSTLQFKLLTRLVNPEKPNIMVVGDDSQSIYRFRGANLENFLNFKNLYPDTKQIFLDRNYRSTGEIVTLSNHIISHNTAKIDKTAISDKGNRGHLPTYFKCASIYEETITIVQLVEKQIAAGIPPGEMSVIYRNHKHSWELQSAFLKHEIPFFVKEQNKKLLDKPCLQDAIAWLRVLTRSSDGNADAWARVLEYVPGFEGTASLEFRSQLINRPDPLEAVLSGNVTLTSQDQTLGFRWLQGQLRAIQAKQSVYDKVALILEPNRVEGMIQYRFGSGLTEVEKNRHRADLQRLQAQSRRYFYAAQLISAYEKSKDTFADDPNKDPEGKVVLQTAHASKGLEYHTVFGIRVADKFFPSYQSLTVEDVEEERRLFYVLASRAKERLCLFFPRDISYNPDTNKWNTADESPFMQELDPSTYQVVQIPEYRHTNSVHLDLYRDFMDEYKSRHARPKSRMSSFSKGFVADFGDGTARRR